jgi:hypothetical protein
VNTEVFRDLPDDHTRLTVASDAHHIITKLTGIRLRHNNILSGHPPGQANSDVT